MQVGVIKDECSERN